MSQRLDTTSATVEVAKRRHSTGGDLQTSLPEAKRRKPTINTTLNLPLEIMADIFNLLPQHRVYPFLSLSRSINNLVYHRLLRKVFVLKKGYSPLLVDDIEELFEWLYFSEAQFLHIQSTGRPWPALVTIIDVHKRHFRANDTMAQFAGPDRTYFTYHEIKATTLLKFVVESVPTTLPYLSRLTVTEGIEVEPLAKKIRVDNLLIEGEVVDIDQWVDLSSVKQLSLVCAYRPEPDNIYYAARQLTNLQDLFVADNGTHIPKFKKFPRTIKRLVLSWSRVTDFAAVRFAEHLEYLEIGLGAGHENWPRRFVAEAHVPVKCRYMYERTFPKLKFYVNHGLMFRVDRAEDGTITHTPLNKYCPCTRPKHNNCVLTYPKKNDDWDPETYLASDNADEEPEAADEESEATVQASEAAEEASEAAEEAPEAVDEAPEAVDETPEAGEEAPEAGEEAGRTSIEDQALEATHQESDAADQGPEAVEEASAAADEASETADQARETADEASPTLVGDV